MWATEQRQAKQQGIWFLQWFCFVEHFQNVFAFCIVKHAVGLNMKKEIFIHISPPDVTLEVFSKTRKNLTKTSGLLLHRIYYHLNVLSNRYFHSYDLTPFCLSQSLRASYSASVGKKYDYIIFTDINSKVGSPCWSEYLHFSAPSHRTQCFW